eukprot:COSAG02_NODE_8882_length_2410_cov_12.636954_2_plen_67_part_00
MVAAKARNNEKQKDNTSGGENGHNSAAISVAERNELQLEVQRTGREVVINELTLWTAVATAGQGLH